MGKRTPIHQKERVEVPKAEVKRIATRAAMCNPNSNSLTASAASVMQLGGWCVTTTSMDSAGVAEDIKAKCVGEGEQR
jgi:hypothetical protein